MATELAQAITNAQAAGAISGYTVSVTPLAEGDGSSAFLTINNSATGFTLKGRPETSEPDGLQHNVATAGTVTRTTSAKDSSGAAISLSDATITLDGTAALGDKWVVTITGGMKAGIYQYVVATGDTISTVDDRLQALIDGTAYSADSNRDITIGAAGTFSVAISVEGVDPRGSASIAGTPAGQPLTGDLTAQVKLIDWTTVSVALGGTPYENEVWSLTAGGVT